MPKYGSDDALVAVPFCWHESKATTREGETLHRLSSGQARYLLWADMSFSSPSATVCGDGDGAGAGVQSSRTSALAQGWP
jgi:hypothetical protein